MGLGKFAQGHPDKAVEILERARKVAPENAFFAGALAAAYGELGLTEQAKAAYAVFSRTPTDRELGRIPQSWWRTATPELAWAMVDHPFADRGVLDRLANGFRVAGALDLGYLPLHPGNKLSGPEIKSLLFGRKISGRDFWDVEKRWTQQRTDDGAVEHSGLAIHAGIGTETSKLVALASGISRIEVDMLCETWPELTVEVCVVIFRLPEGHARAWLGDYVMVTEQGPQLFRLIE